MSDIDIITVRWDAERDVYKVNRPNWSGGEVVLWSAVKTMLASQAAEVARLTKENDWLRAYTGQSAKDCVYCGLGADEQGKCDRGFPGCARADDQMLCREVDVAMERDALRASLASAEAEVARLTVEAARHETEMGAMIDERDEMETALSSAHTALGEDGEWACRIPSPPPPDSGHLCLDVPALAERVATENAALLARVEAAEKDAARAREFLLAFINGGANQDFRLWARELYAAMREGGK